MLGPSAPVAQNINGQSSQIPGWLFDTAPQRRHKIGQAAWFLLWLGVTLIGAFVLHPAKSLHGTHTQLGFPACYSVIIFDRPCPGCGLTTSWTSVLHGDFGHAFAAHALGPIIYVLFTLSALACLFAVIRGYRIRTETRFATIALGTMIVLFLVYGIARFATTKYNDPYHQLAMTRSR